MEERDPMQEERKAGVSFESLHILLGRVRDGTFQEILDDWKWIFSYARPHQAAIFLYVALGILSTTLGLASSVAGKYTIDIITGYQTSKLVFVILIMVGSSLFSILFSNLISRISTKLAININNDVQADVFDKLMDADWMEINRFSNGDILNRFNGDVNTVASNAVNWLPTLILAVYRFVATFFVILHYDLVMAFIALASAPVLLFSSRYILKKQREYGKKVREVSSEVMSFEVESFYNLDTIKSFGTAPHYNERLHWWQKKLKGITLDYNLFSIKTNVFLSLIGMLIQFIAFGYCLYLLWIHSITYGTMTLFLQQRSGLSSAFNNMLSVIPSFLNSSISAHRLREMVELPKEVHIAESEKLDRYIADGFTVQMSGIDFKYVEDKQVITRSNLIARPGEIVALVGPSGEGKTTLIRLILGLIHPEKGEAVIRAFDGTEVPMNAETRHLFSYVPQGNTILSGTIAENLRAVKPDATDEELTKALKQACAWDFVRQMPDGIHSKVGERGHGLSEGQAQRVAIARALLRDAPVILLDEATSALDVTTERQVLRNIISGESNKTCIVTTHRPSVLNLCQRVYRVVDTKVTELSEEEASRMAMDF